MKKLIRILGRIIYFFAKRLPSSFSRIKVGQKALRALCGRMILQSCGKKVNIEKMRISTTQLGSVTTQGWG